MEVENALQEVEMGMKKSLEHMHREFSSVRAGAANPSLVENLRVEVSAYNSVMKLKELAVISVPEPKMILIQPFDPSTSEDIEKAISESKLGIYPVSEGKIIRLPLPALTEERRKEFLKIIKEFAENARIQVRACRKNGMDEAKNLLKDKILPEDSKRDFEQKIQEITDSCIQEIDKEYSQKEKEILTV